MKWQEGAFATCAAAVIAAIAAAVILPSYNSAKRADMLTAEKAFSHSAFDVSLLVHTIFSAPRDRFQASTGLFALSGALPHLEFLKLSLAVRPMYGMVPDSTIFKGVYDLMWAPIIHDEDRVAFETGVSNATGKYFRFQGATPSDGRVRAADAAIYAPILELPTADVTDDPLRKWGVDLLSLPNVNATVREAIRTKKAQVTAGLCYFSPLTDPNPSRFSCSPYRALLIQPIIARGDLGSLEPVDPFGSPYAHPRLLSIIRKNRGVPGEVIGLLVGNLNWMESGDKIMARLPPGIQSEASKHSSLFIEDITDVVGEVYPHADCSRQSPHVLLHSIPFGKGSPILLFSADEPMTEGIAQRLYSTQASRSQIMCVAGKQWNVVLTLSYPWLSTMIGNSRRDVLLLAIAILSPLAAVVVMFLTNCAAQFVVDRKRADLDELKQKSNLEAHEHAMTALIEEFQKPIVMMGETARGLLGSEGALAGMTAGPARVLLEVLKANLPRMTLRMQALLALSQNRAGKLSFPLEDFDIREFVKDLADLHRCNTVVPLTYCVDHNVPRIVTASKTGIEQVLMNGLLNSCQQCTHRGRNWIRLEVHKNPVLQRLQFRVVDNGPGLRGKTEDELFAFWDADVLDSRGLPRLRPKSLALSTFGLPFSKRIARAMGGDLSISDDPDGTAVTTLTLLVPFEEPSSHGTFGVPDNVIGAVEPLGALMQPLELADDRLSSDDTQAGSRSLGTGGGLSGRLPFTQSQSSGSRRSFLEGELEHGIVEAKPHLSRTERKVQAELELENDCAADVGPSSGGTVQSSPGVAAQLSPSRQRSRKPTFLRPHRSVMTTQVQGAAGIPGDVHSDVATAGTNSPSPLATTTTPVCSPPRLSAMESPLPNAQLGRLEDHDPIVRTHSVAASSNPDTTASAPSFFSTPFVASSRESGGSSSVFISSNGGSGRGDDTDSFPLANRSKDLRPLLIEGFASSGDSKPVRMLVFEPDQSLVLMNQANLMSHTASTGQETVPQAVTYVSSIQDTERELVATGSVKLPEYADLVSDFSSNHHGHGYHACLLEADGSCGPDSQSLLSRIKQVDSKFPVVAVTGDPSSVHRLETLGYDFVLQKPYHPQYLSQLLHNLCFGHYSSVSQLKHSPLRETGLVIDVMPHYQ